MKPLMQYFRKPEVEPQVNWQDNALSPDIWKLEQFQYQLIFVSDDMMTGGKNHSIIKDAAYSSSPVHPTCYTHDKFTFFEKDLGDYSFPVTLPWDYKPTGRLRNPIEVARVKGELYAIRPNQFISLDKHRQNGLQFRRIRTRILLPYREVRYKEGAGWPAANPSISIDYIYTVTAWMYVGVSEYWDDQIGGIFQSTQVFPREHDVRKTWIDKFFRFETK